MAIPEKEIMDFIGELFKGFADPTRVHILYLLAEKEQCVSDIAEQVEISVKYEGYIQRQQKQVEEFRRTENVKIPVNIDYNTITGLRIEAQQKLARQKPRSLAQAGRIPGVSPADVAVLMVWLEKRAREAAQQN